MKSILISIRPEWVAKILNGEKTVEIRKTAPKCELPIEVYIYCTKGGERPIYLPWEFNVHKKNGEYIADCDFTKGNGKVVAKFTLKKAEKFIQGLNEAEYEHLPNFALKDYDYYGLEDLMGKACLNDEEITKYAPDLSFYAWHISDLVIFDEPKELSEFKKIGYRDRLERELSVQFDLGGLISDTVGAWYRIKRVPQSWCYVEARE